MAVAAGASLVCALVAYVPIASAAHAARLETRLQAAMVAMLIRLFASLIVVFVVLQTGLAPAATPFVAWIGIDYAALLVLETRVVAAAARTVGRSGGTEVA